MDTSALDTDTMDLGEQQMLPELSFEDFLDDIPPKKHLNEPNSDPLELDDETNTTNLDDDTLNTPKLKKYPPSHDQPKQQTHIELQLEPMEQSTTYDDPLEIEQEQPNETPQTTIQVQLPKSTTITVTPTTTTSAILNKPIVLNGKNILPKTAGNQFIKIAPKPVGPTGSNITAVNVVKAVGPTTISVNPVKAVTCTSAVLANATTSAAVTPTLPGTTTTATTTTGKKIIYIKKPPGATMNGGKFVVQRANGQPIVMTNSKLIKLSPKQPQPVAVVSTTTTTTTTVAASATTASTSMTPSSSVAPASLAPTTFAVNKITKLSTIPTATLGSISETSGTLTLSTKTPPTSTTSTITSIALKAPASSSILSTAKSGGKLVVNGKQYLVKSNQKFIKISPNAVTTAAAAIPSTSAASGTGEATQPQRVHAIPIPGKQVKYVHNTSAKQIVMNNFRLVQKINMSPSATATNAAAGTQGATSATTTTTTAVATTASAVATKTTTAAAVATTTTTAIATATTPTESATSTSSTSGTTTTAAVTTIPSVTATGTAMQPVKILNSIPQKFTLTLSPKMVQNIVLRRTSNDPKKELPSTSGQKFFIKQSSTVIDPTGILGKRKISDLNNEIKRVTTTNNDGDSVPGSASATTNTSNTTTSTTTAGETGPEIKKTANGNRIVVVPRSMLKTHLSGPISMSGTATTSAVATMQISRSGMVQRMPVQSANISTSTTTAGSSTSSSTTTSTGASGAITNTTNSSAINIIHSPRKLFSVLKTTNGDPAKATFKSGVIGRQLHEKQQVQLKKEPIVTGFTVPSSNVLIRSIPSVIMVPPQVGQTRTSTPNPKITNVTTMGNGGKTVTLNIKDEPMDEELDFKLKGGILRRKHCNCSKSQCLKLYCDCFANGEFCYNCTCKDCFNNLQYEDERQRAIKSCLERNPRAFKPKITAAQDDMRSHNKGCNCKRSGCLKNYCECYEAKIPCSSNCKCVGCRNIEDRPDLDMDPPDDKSAMNAPAVKSRQHKSRKEPMLDANGKIISDHGTDDSNHSYSGSSFSDAGQEGGVDGVTGDKQRCNFITQEVVDATVQCMFSQADECIKSDLPGYQSERMVMEEMGRCLVEIIDFSIRNTDLSFTQE